LLTIVKYLMAVCFALSFPPCTSFRPHSLFLFWIQSYDRELQL
jgi:hypothetical protein